MIEILLSAGSGRAFVILCDDESYRGLVERVSEVLSTSSRVVAVKMQRITDESFSAANKALAELLAHQKIRMMSLIAFGACVSLAQDMYLTDSKMIRTMVLVDGTSRPHPTLPTRVIDALEEKLPFGLPMRASNRGFDIRPFWHRVRCPVLLVSTSRGGTLTAFDAAVSQREAPTAWFVDLSHERDSESEKLAVLVSDFQEVPAKCPQKNVSAA